MLGQSHIKELKQKFVKGNFIPPLLVIIGDSKSGKTTAAQYIAEGLGQFVRCGNKVEEVREVIETAYKQSEPIFYFFSNIQDMSLAALNALLKITEEPPFKARFILTLNMKENCLGTIISRALVIEMEPYTKNEMLGYCTDKGLSTFKGWEELLNSPGLLKAASLFDFEGMAEQIKLFLFHPNLKEAISLVKNIKTKEDEEVGWDLELFIDTLRLIFVKRKDFNIHSKPDSEILKSISGLKFYLKYPSINKKVQLENLLFKIARIK